VFESNRWEDDSTQADMRYLLSGLSGLERSPAAHGVQSVAGERQGVCIGLEIEEGGSKLRTPNLKLSDSREALTPLIDKL